MKDRSRTNVELIEEISVLKQRIQELEQSESVRKQTEEALRESEERFRALSENAPDIIYTMNLLGAITYVNPSWKRILGHDEEEILGRYFIEFTKEEDKRTYRKLFKSIRDEGKSVNNHIGVMLTKEGRERIFNMNSAFNLDSQGRIISVVGSMKDVTEMRDMEKKLNQAQKMESIGTLAGGIAHDFNNLLMGIQGHASLMLLDIDPSHPHYERLKRIEEQVASGADLTKQLLGFARGGRYEVRTTAMNDIIKKTSSMFGRTKKEITIHLKYGKDLWAVEVDRGQMEQVFMNLYVNAWQAMPGGGEIYLETENILLDDERVLPYTIKPGKYVKTSITDTGMGMDEKTRERIFDPFFSTKAMGRGTGLGLATVYGIIKGHEGMINIYSETGHGTTFTIYLPASEKEVVMKKAVDETVLRGTETILLVDDEKMILDVSKEMLEFLGYRIYIAGSGQEAIAVYREKRNDINLVILDMIMPGISGGETFDRLREINPEIRVLLSSGYSINGHAQQILDRGCNGFLQKPFHLEKLSRKVREMLD
ncbi:MAG: PAS domain S-box protein [Deltaproteobacteria bacterium]|nr:PAS domain S-box protein [Deltaproteobacteria bacterium]